MSIPLQHRAENLAALLPPLLLEAERVASVVRQGTHGRRRAGQGESFWQFRRYAPGDPAERIDWRQSARTDKYFIREREWEAAQSAYLWADNSGSMRYQSQNKFPQKSERAQILMLALASLLLRGGETVTWLAEEPVIARGRGGLERIAHVLAHNNDNASMPPSVPIARHAHVILCSDFLMPRDELEKRMRHHAALNLRGALLHVLDPAELALPFEGRIEMKGLEDEQPLLLQNAASFHAAYHQRMQDHQAWLMRLAESAGWFYLRDVTENPAHLSLMRLFDYLAADHRGI
jgi:uncharacterized protein (DUF58 family)